MLFIKDLKEVVYKYYPKNNNSVFTNLYYDTIHIKRLEWCAENCKLKNIPWNRFLLNTEKVITGYKVTDVSYKYDGWLSRSYGLVINLRNDNNLLVQIDANVSYLIPYYSISILTFKKIDKFMWKYPPAVAYFSNDIEIAGIIEILKNQIEETFCYKEFPSDLLFTIVDDISFENIKSGEFTFLNAFFINAYRLRF